jgi:hypothetical protein
MSNSDLISFYEDFFQRLINNQCHERSIKILSETINKIQKNPFNYEHCFQAAAAGDIEELKKMHQAGFPLKISIKDFFDNDDEDREDNQDNDDEDREDNEVVYYFSTSSAAENGHLDCLRYAHENGCEWNERTTSFAAENGHLDCLRYAYENGCKWNVFTTSGAAENGHLDCLKYAFENGCKLDADTTYFAAENGHLDCLRYAHENGCEWHKDTIYFAADNGHLECLRYAIENGCPYDIENEQVIEKIKKLNII